MSRLDAGGWNTLGPGDGSITDWRANIGTVLATVVACEVSILDSVESGQSYLTWWSVVADGEVRSNVRTDVGETAWAVLSGATDSGGVLPDDLREVAPVLEVGHVWVRLTVKAVEPVDLTVVEEVGDDSGDIGSFDTSGNVLTVATTVGVDIVGVNTGSSDGGSSAGKTGVPGEVRGRVVGTVVVVVVDDGLLVGGGHGWGGSSSGRAGADNRGRAGDRARAGNGARAGDGTNDGAGADNRAHNRAGGLKGNRFSSEHRSGLRGGAGKLRSGACGLRGSAAKLRSGAHELGSSARKLRSDA